MDITILTNLLMPLVLLDGVLIVFSDNEDSWRRWALPEHPDLGVPYTLNHTDTLDCAGARFPGVCS